jgi:cation-transporting P-type ATPase I
MDVSRLLRQSAGLPLRVASRCAATAISGGVALATIPVRGAASLVSGITDIELQAGLAAEFLGGKPARRCWRGGDRAWIEVCGLHDAQRGRELGDAVLASVRDHPGVASAVLNYPLSRLVVSTRADGPGVHTLCDLVAAAEKRWRESAHAAAQPERRVVLPGDPIVLVGRLVALTANTAGLFVAITGQVVPWPRVPLAIPAAAVNIVDYQPKLRQLLENRFGSSVTDTALAVAGAAAYTVTQSPASLTVDALLHLVRAAESLSGVRAWAEHEPTLARQAECPDVFRAARPRPPPPGPVETHANRCSLAQILGATAIGATTRNVNAAATAAMVAAPKATRTARESFAATLGRGLAHAVVLRPEALRRLDRVDAVLIDPRALVVDELRVSRIRGAPEHDRVAVWQWA